MIMMSTESPPPGPAASETLSLSLNPSHRPILARRDRGPAWAGNRDRLPAVTVTAGP
jgi:hypothetical protein